MSCVDICHFFLPPEYQECNYWGDVVISIQLLFFLLVLPSIPIRVVGRITGLLLAMMVFREAISLMTRCSSCVNPHKRPWLGGDDRWYVISGHLLTSMMLTYMVWQGSSSSWFIQWFMGMFPVLIFGIQILTREHYSKDMFITALLGFLLLKAYG